MKKSLAMCVREAEIRSCRLTADRGSFKEHEFNIEGKARWSIEGDVACRSGLHVHMFSYSSLCVVMLAKWRGREYRLRLEKACRSKESLRRAAVVFADRVIKRAGR